MTSKIVRKTIEEAQNVPNAEIDFSDKNLIHLDDMPRLWTMKNITRLTLSHNKVSEIPPALANLENMEILNLFNNALQEVPITLSTMPKLRYVNFKPSVNIQQPYDKVLWLNILIYLTIYLHRILNLAMNRLDSLPRGFGSFPVLEVLDLSYNSLNDESMPGNFWVLHTLRALYLR